MGISVEEAVNNKLISDSLIETLPKDWLCECGAVLELTESLSQLYCASETCYVKMSHRLHTMVKELGIDGFDLDTAKRICKDFNLKTPYQISLLSSSDDTGIDDILDRVNGEMNKGHALWEVVRMAFIPNIEFIAYKIFNGYSSIDEAYKDIKRYQVPFIADRLGLRSASTGVIAVTIYNELIKYETELRFGETKFNVVKEEGERINIVISGNPNGFNNKQTFVDYVNNRYNGKVNVLLLNSVVGDVHTLITDGDINNRKYKTACKLNEKTDGENIIISTSDEFIDYLDGIYN